MFNKTLLSFLAGLSLGVGSVLFIINNDKKVVARDLVVIAQQKPTIESQETLPNALDAKAQSTEAYAKNIVAESNQSSFSLLKSMIQFVPESMLKQIVEDFNILNAEDIGELENFKQSMERLIDIWGLKSTPNAELELYGGVSFSDRLPSRYAIAETSQFNTSDTTIYANFSSEHYSKESVLVKWISLDENKVMLFKKVSINPNSPLNYISLNQQNGWSPGNYQVEIYGLGENIPLLGSSSFIVFD